MFHILKKTGLDWYLNFIVIFLLTFSLITIYSLSLNEQSAGLNNFHKQTIFLVISLFFYLFFSFYDYRLWKKYSGFLYFFGTILLLSVLWFGKSIRGTSGWFDLGFFNLQPTEIFKIFIILALAKHFSKNSSEKITFKSMAISFVYVIIPFFFILKQPDFGSATVILVIWVGMLFISNLDKKFFIAILSVLLVFSFVGWKFILKDYQKTRIENFLNPQNDPLGAGYNVIQSTVAVGSGGLKGKGMGQGSQSQLNFLPEKHNDFIFAAIAEENGFIGTSMIIMAFIFLFFRLHFIALNSKDLFGQLIINGLMIMFFFHILINIGMNIGLMPVAGLSLPFLSYGGSFLVVSMSGLGLAQSIWKRRRKNELPAFLN
ncbi:MAG: rod shape-determining protein RodA [Candidatus Moranbacteria bacterium]|jgi:rod shape determining protein RodA|nr:rod shape-determining protein RodA [Candidatus Moranbacteria bacterium]